MQNMGTKDLEANRKNVGSEIASSSDEQTIRKFVDRQTGNLEKKPSAGDALKGLTFISSRIKWTAVEKTFDELTSSTHNKLQRNQFGECIGMKEKGSEEFALQLFDALAGRNCITTGCISKDILRKLWDQISDANFHSRLRIFFDMVDKDADGKISEEEVRKVIEIWASANNLPSVAYLASKYTAMIMDGLDPDGLGYIETEIWEMIFSRQESQIRSQSEELEQTKETNPGCKWFQGIIYIFLQNWQKIWLLALWIGIMLGLFTYKFIEYRNKAVFGIMGYCVLPRSSITNNTITWLRNKTKLGVIVPLDSNISFHQVIVIGIGIGVAAHALAHLTCNFPRLIHAKEGEYELMQPFFGKHHPGNYWWFLKGVEGLTGIIMVILMAIAFTLAIKWPRLKKVKDAKSWSWERLAGFNMFWYSHHLFIIVYTLLIVHGSKTYLSKEWYTKTTWMYLAVPIALYTCERLIRSFRSRAKSVNILQAMALHMSKPKGFKYRSGQYVFLKCSAVSPFEWHPFSLTSSPADGHLSVHIRVLGDWTAQLKNVLSKSSSGAKSIPVGTAGESNIQFAKVMVDGPYGALAQDYKNYEVVLLVGFGIGATSMISIIKDIVNNMKDNEESDLERGKSAATSARNSSHNKGSIHPRNNTSEIKMKRGYFYWVIKEEGSIELLKNEMTEVAKMDTGGVIEPLNFICVRVRFGKYNSWASLIASIQCLDQAKNGIDIVCGTSIKFHFGRPDWNNVYMRISRNHTDSKVGVFYCGPPGAGKEQRQLALKFSESRETSTQFEFHKENF
ncbi:hypothetical protein MKW98_018989 [Papaver atlanticum]|uniref:Uncharacterized protein n=1 Tax=Papaver atlanticum TaxID=357466 RepID=A0AAD4XYH2_9MAGN|nr:hypothetical protein MKW98_018989 [Papaver atlanticum]